MRNRRSRVLTALLWCAALGWIAVLFFFSGQSAEQSGSLSLLVTEFVLKLFPSLPFTVEQLHPFLRKLAHFTIFGLEGFLLALAVRRSYNRKWIGGMLSLGSCALLAVLNEYHQSFSAGRSCELRDMLIDTAGALTGIFFALLVRRIRKYIARRRVNVIIS